MNKSLQAYKKSLTSSENDGHIVMCIPLLRIEKVHIVAASKLFKNFNIQAQCIVQSLSLVTKCFAFHLYKVAHAVLLACHIECCLFFFQEKYDHFVATS